ncbi:DUF3558 domain-containing protein [Saccharopolyspora sp. NPDC047091]|uniref:DUF3558 domain-containing protein n=1 Tax=Saccharopolyspora sp. NPDC047091 TaxID=3155924 RepID=UPI0034049E89
MTSVCSKLGLLVVVPALLAGCALNEAPAAPPPATDQGAGSGLGLPERPRDLPVAGMQEDAVCAVLTPEQVGTLGVGRGVPQAESGTFDTPGCTWLSGQETSGVGLTIAVAPLSFEDSQSQKSDGSSNVAAIFTLGQGFGALQGQIPGAENLGCFVDVDAAEGQTLEVGTTSIGGDDVSNQDLCAKAKQAAEFAVSNLQAQG